MVDMEGCVSYRDEPGPGDGHFGDDPLARVGRPDGHAIASLQAQVQQPCGQPVSLHNRDSFVFPTAFTVRKSVWQVPCPASCAVV